MDPFSMASLISGGAQLVKGGFGLFNHHHNKNPANVGIKELNKIPGQTKGYYDPYINAGRDSLNKLQDQYGQLSSDPGKRFAELGAGYKESPGYQAKLREALAGANNAAAMGGGGGLGTYGHQQMAGQAAGDVANEDYEQYINHIMGLYGKGLEGEGQLNQQGQRASEGYADILGNNTAQKANLMTQGQDWKNQNSNQDWSNIIGGAGQAGAGYFLGPEIHKMMQQRMQNQGGHRQGYGQGQGVYPNGY